MKIKDPISNFAETAKTRYAEILKRVSELRDGEFLPIEADDEKELMRIYYGLARHGVKRHRRGLMLYVGKSENGKVNV